MRCRLWMLLVGFIAAMAVLALRYPQAVADDPLVLSPSVMAEFAQYKARSKPLYFAVSTDGLFSWWSYCMDYNCQATQSYRQEAIEHCEHESGTDCVILAVGDVAQLGYRVGDPATMVAAKPAPCTVDAIAAGSAPGAIIALLRPATCSNFRSFGHSADFKAFATTDPAKFKVARGWATRYGSADEAVKEALVECAKSAEELGLSDPCELFAIGDIVVRGMSEAEKRAATDLYKKNKNATNADLRPSG